MAEPSDSMIDLVNWAEDEARRIDIWEATLRSEGKCLDQGQETHRRRARKVAHLLDMVRAHRAAFLGLVEQRRAEAESKVAEAQARREQKPTTGSSPRSSPARSTS